MNNEELFLKRFKLFRTLVVASEKPEILELCLPYGELCSFSACRDVENIDAQQPPHIVLLFLDKDLGTAEECMQKLKILPYWQLLLFAHDPKSPSVMAFALKYRAFGLHAIPRSKNELVGALASVMPPMIERLQESSRAAQLHKIAEMGPAKLLFGSGGQILYLNGRAKKLFNIDRMKEGNDAVAKLLEPLNESGKKRVLRTVEYEEKSLMICKEEEGSGKEALFTILELDGSGSTGAASHVTRIEFIDRLKDKMAQRIDASVPLFLLMIRMKNFAQIVEEFDWMTAHDIQKELNDLLLKAFENFESYGLWQPDMALLLFENGLPEEMKKRISLFISQMHMQEFTDNIVPAIEFTLIEIGSSDLNAVINLIEKEYAGSLSVADTKAFDIYKISSSSDTPEEPDILRQFLTNIMTGRLPLKLLNIYKGLPISTPTKILKMEEDKIIVTAEKIQKFVMDIEKEVVLQSAHLPSDIHADVHFVDAARPLAILKHLKTMKTSINNRKHTRVTVTSRLPITLKIDKSHYTGYVHDISINSIAILFNLDKFEENELKERRAEVSFKLPWENEEGFVNITVTASVLFNRNEKEFHKVIVLLEPDDLSESYIFDYIYKRQKELIKEIKSRL
ncbi:PilZ domain-containing protein [Hydrogenimonas sp.]